MLTGSADNDVLNGGPGTDTLNGGAGNDLLIDNFGGDIVDGGAGFDILRVDDGALALSLGGLCALRLTATIRWVRATTLRSIFRADPSATLKPFSSRKRLASPLRMLIPMMMWEQPYKSTWPTSWLTALPTNCIFWVVLAIGFSSRMRTGIRVCLLLGATVKRSRSIRPPIPRFCISKMGCKPFLCDLRFAS